MECKCEIVNIPDLQESTENGSGTACFLLKSPLTDARLTGVERVAFNGVEVPRKDIRLDLGDGVVLAGEISLAAAISSQDWVSIHEQYGRNR